MERSDNTAAGTIEARTVDAGRGVAWWTEAWALFMRSALLWVALTVILVVAFTLIGRASG
jgi:hypothetical protein